MIASHHSRASRVISGWSPTPYKIVREALKLADVNHTDLVFDLGCGDGRIVLSAARAFGARAIGFDVDKSLVRLSRRKIARFGLHHLARVRFQSMFAIPDLHRASVVFLFLPQGVVNRLKPVLLSRCQVGTRIVSVASGFYNWTPCKEAVVTGQRRSWWIGLWYI